MQFACIRDCFICPLNCKVRNINYPVKIVKEEKINPIPEVITEDLDVPDSNIPVEVYEKKEISAIQSSLNLPVLTEIQYEIKDASKKGLFGFLKKIGANKMLLNIEELAEDAMKEEGVDRKKVMAILAKGLRHKMNEIDTYEEIYREVYGDELTPEKCDQLIAMLYQGDEKGAKWTLVDTNGIAAKLDYHFEDKTYSPEMFRAAMHVKYYDNAFPLKKSGKEMSSTDWGRMADFYFTADDEEKSVLVDYFFQKVRNLIK